MANVRLNLYELPTFHFRFFCFYHMTVYTSEQNLLAEHAKFQISCYTCHLSYLLRFRLLYHSKYKTTAHYLLASMWALTSVRLRSKEICVFCLGFPSLRKNLFMKLSILIGGNTFPGIHCVFVKNFCFNMKLLFGPPHQLHKPACFHTIRICTPTHLEYLGR